MCCGKIGLLLWKNMILRRRHWCITICEILFPTFIYLWLVYINVQGRGGLSLGRAPYYEPGGYGPDPGSGSGSGYGPRPGNGPYGPGPGNGPYGPGPGNGPYGPGPGNGPYGPGPGNGPYGPGPVPYSRSGSERTRGDDEFTHNEENLITSLMSYIPIGDNGSIINFIGYTPNTPVAKNITSELRDRIENEIPGTKVFIRNFTNENNMESVYKSKQKRKHKRQRENFLFGIVYEKGTSSDNVEKEVSYKIRPIRNKLDTTKLTFNEDSKIKKDFDSYTEHASAGVLGVQIIMDKILMKTITRNAGQEIDLSDIDISLSRFPIPPSRISTRTSDNRVSDDDILAQHDTDLRQGLGISLAAITMLSFLFIVPTVVQEVVSEKETGVKELMKMAGLPDWMHTLGWMLNTLCVLPITVTIITMCLCFAMSSSAEAIMTRSNFALIWFIHMLYGIWTVTYCFLISSFFEKPSLATTYGILLWIVSYGGAGVGMELHMKNYSKGAKLALCFVPNVAIQLVFSTLTKLEYDQEGATFKTLYKSFPNPKFVPLGHVLLMMMASSIANILVSMYIEAILPRKFGVRKPLWFLFMPSEWDCLNKRSRVSPSPVIATAEIGAPISKSQVEGDKQEGEEKGVSTSPGGNDPKGSSTKIEGGDLKVENQPASITPTPSATETRPGFQEEPKDMFPGVQIINLKKRFGRKKVAVDGLSVNMFEGQIFCLLGENGAGKTTTMSILTGMMSQTSGTAKISGYDINTGMNQIRKMLGLCPQHNMLFERLTVMEHLKFFGALKGLKFSSAAMDGLRLLQTLKMGDKANELSCKLSGGQKRKLQLGCALIGDSRILFLDEPSSGMDPEARRAIWDILLDYREGRTIILTTHFMEEADVLGDRIGIMSAGKLQCCGSPSFLKKFYGAGFTLNMTTMEGADKDKILKTVQKHVANAHFKESHSSSSTTISLVLPTDSNTSTFPAMFKELRSGKEQLKIEEMGMGWTSMDDVFIKVEELSHPPSPDDEVEEENQNQKEVISTVETEKPPPPPPLPPTQEKEVKSPATQSKTEVEPQSVDPALVNTDLEQNQQPEVAPPLAMIPPPRRGLCFQQFIGLFIKHLVLMYRKKQYVLSQVLIPVLLTIGITVAASSLLELPDDTPQVEKGDPMPVLKLSLSSYKDSVTPLSYDGGNSLTEPIGSAYWELLGSSKKLNLSDASGFDYGELSNHADLPKFIVGADLTLEVVRDSATWKTKNQTKLQGWYSSLAFHSAPLSLNLLTNAILQSHMNGDTSFKIQTSIHPFYDENPSPDFSKFLNYKTKGFYSANSKFFGAMITVLFPIVMALFVTGFVTEPTEERLNQGKQLQMMTGVGPFQYWGAIFLVDLILTLFTISLIIIVVYTFEIGHVFSNNGGLFLFFLILLIYCTTAIVFSYIYTTCVKSSGEGFRRIICTHIFTGLGIGIIVYLMEYLLAYQWLLIPLNILGRLFPNFGLTRALFQYTFASFKNAECTVIPDKYLDVLCQEDIDLYTLNLESPSNETLLRCCSNCKDHFADKYERIARFKKIQEANPAFAGRGIEGQEEGPCFEFNPYFRWVDKHTSINFFNPFNFWQTVEAPGLNHDLTWLAVLAIIYLIFLMLIEFKIIWKTKNLLDNQVYPFVSVNDEDVMMESERVRYLVESGMVYEDALVVNNLSKNFDNFWAVSSLSFGVHFGECFGLLGVNGAGKTTAFRMLTGDETVTFGDAFMGFLSLQKGRSQFMSRIGYCPQFDGIIEWLTGKEMLCLYARLRGLKGKQVKKEADKWLKKTGLTESANVPCGKYSGGMKRRLSTAIALIGDPPIVLLDEPTSGVDPVSRRKFWKIISSVKNAGQSVILTSHSMEECEAICNRLGIMVNGEMQCFGGVQHLKNKFAQGYSMTVKLNEEAFMPKVEEIKPEEVPNPSNPENPSPPGQNPNQAQVPPQMQGQMPKPLYPQQPMLPNQSGMKQVNQFPQPMGLKGKRIPGVGQLGGPGVGMGPPAIKSKAAQFEENPEVDKVVRSILETFESCELKDRHMSTLKFQIYDVFDKAPLTWDELYAKMEKTKEALKPKIEEYAILETSLEEVFLAFAKMQYDHERPVPKQGCGCCRCCCCC